MNGQLMAVGGFDGTTYLKTIEVYDPDANTWRYVPHEKHLDLLLLFITGVSVDMRTALQSVRHDLDL